MKIAEIIYNINNAIMVKGHLQHRNQKHFGWNMNRRNFRHGKYGASIYHSWAQMKNRCLSPKNKDYHHYGGRGITICEKWLSFEGFENDMGPKPRGHSLERIDNNKGYSKENCKWSTRREQSGNTRAKSKTGYTGVRLSGKKFQAIIGIGGRNGIKKYLGTFATAEDAHDAYVKAAKEIENLEGK